MSPMEPVWHQPGPDDLYVHLAVDGGIFVAPGEDLAHSAWVTEAELRRRVAAVPRSACIWLSEPDPAPLTRAPAEAVMAADATIAEALPLPETQRQEGITALMSAAYVGAHELVVDLLARGAPVDARDDKGSTALMLAAEAGQTEIAEALHRAGADLEAVDHDGTTPLMLAAWSGQAATVARLRELGADPTRTRPTPGDPAGAPIDARGLALGRGHAEAAAACGPSPPVPGPDSAPVRLGPPRTRVPWVVGGLVAALVVGSLLLSDRVGPVDVLVGALLVAGVAAAMALVMAQRNRYWIQFDGSSMTVNPAFGSARTFDLGDVTRIRARQYQWGLVYRLRLRGDRGNDVRLTIPAWASVELVRRLAAFPGIDADRHTAAQLDAWREAGGVGVVSPEAGPQAMP